MELNTAIWGDNTEWQVDETINYYDDGKKAYNGKYKSLSEYVTNNIFELNTAIDNTILYCGQAAGVTPWGDRAIYSGFDSLEGTTPTPTLEVNRQADIALFTVQNNTSHFRGIDGIRAIMDESTNPDSLTNTGYTRWSPYARNFPDTEYPNTNLPNTNYQLCPVVDFDLRCMIGVIYVDVCSTVDGTRSTMTLYDFEHGNYSDYVILYAFMRLALLSGSDSYSIVQVSSPARAIGFVDMRPIETTTGDYINYVEAVQNVPSIPLFGFNEDRYSWNSTYRCFNTYWGYNNTDTEYTNTMSHAGVLYSASRATFVHYKIQKDYQTYSGLYNVWYYMENNADNLEYLRKAAASYGIWFTDNPTSDILLSPTRWTDNNMMLGLLRDGVGYGDYTRGSGNLENPAYNWTSSHQSGYKQPVLNPIERPDRICVYSIYEPQDGYNNNGEAVLWPSELESFKEDKGRWDIELKHPIDPYGKWTYIIGQNCIKVNGQIFRIDETEIYTDANQQYIKAHANHISFDLKDRFIGDATFTVNGGTAYMEQVYIESTRLFPTQQPTPYEYTFEIVSDITGELTGDIHDQTIIGAFYGDDNSFANRYGGELYRDNFHISINSTMENAPAAPAFQLRYGTDLTKISYKIDFSEWITELLCEDNFGNILGVSYVGSEWIIHHHKTKRLHFTYSPDTPDPGACLTKDMYNYWQTVNTPKVSIDVAVANLKNDPKYKGFVDLQNLDVGYTGNVYFEQFGIDINLKIVSIRRNELTGEAIQIVLGNSQGSFVKSPVMSQTIVPNSSVSAIQAQTLQDMQTEIETVKLKSMRTWGGIKAYKWSEVKSYKWEEIKNGNADN